MNSWGLKASAVIALSRFKDQQKHRVLSIRLASGAKNACVFSIGLGFRPKLGQPNPVFSRSDWASGAKIIVFYRSDWVSGLSWANLSQLRPTWGQLGPTWGQLEVKLGQLERLGASLGPIQANKRPKTLSEITRQKVCRDHCRPDTQKSI